jgi:hypothetical protein
MQKGQKLYLFVVGCMRSGHELKKELKEMDAWVDRERTHVLVSSEEKSVGRSHGRGATGGESTVNLVWLRSEKENGHPVEKRGTENGLS